MTAFLELPTELLCRCLELLDHVSLCACRSVCHELKQTIDADTQCQYTLALAGAGLEDVPISGPGWSTGEKLGAVRRYDRAWRNLEYSSHRTYPSASGGLWELYNGVWGHDVEDGHVFDFIQLPSEIRGIPERRWRVRLDVTPRDFTFDPTHDLLVVVVPHNPNWIPDDDSDSDEEDDNPEPGRVSVHLRTLSDGLRHPHAKTAELEYPSTLNRLLMWSYSIRICGRHLGVYRYSRSGEAELTVWNWIEGKRCLSLWGLNTIKGFMFLDEGKIIVASLVSPNSPKAAVYTYSSLIIYSLSDSAAHLETMMDVDEPAGSVYDTPFLVAIQMPRIPIRNDTRDLQIHSDPSPYVPVDSTSTTPVPFRLNPHDRMLAVHNLLFWEEQPTTKTAMVPFSFIHKCVAESEPGAILDARLWTQTAVHLPEHGRWSVWVCFVYGMRYVHPTVIQDEDGKYYISIADFHEVRRKVARAEQEDSEEKSQMIQPVRLLLPEALQNASNRSMSVMISEDGIVLLSRDLHDRKANIQLIILYVNKVLSVPLELSLYARFERAELVQLAHPLIDARCM
ncbi:unnamed protein product [Peniophora sp. CBMAI 1063]|nr:unnamed protein product [Peniophora sp. CBMAI 1063]